MKSNNLKIIAIGLGCLLAIALIIIIIINQSAPKVETVSKTQILFPTLAKDQNNLLYFNNESEAGFYNLDLATKQISPLSGKIDTPDDIIWSPEKNQAILQVTYSSLFEQYGSVFANPKLPEDALVFWHYNLDTKEMTQLNANIQNVIWSSGGKQIIYSIYDSDSFRNIIGIANPDGTNPQILFQPDYSVADIYYYNQKDNNLIFSALTAGDNETTVDIYQKIGSQEPKLIISGAEGPSVKVSPPGGYLLALKDGKITLVDLESNKIQDIQLKSSEFNVAWGVNDLSLVLATTTDETKGDTFYKIQITDFKKTKINLRGWSGHAGSLILGGNDQNLYWVASDNLLYKLKIK